MPTIEGRPPVPNLAKQSLGIVATAVILAAVVAGGGTYWYMSNRQSAGTQDLRNQISNLKDRIALLQPTPLASTAPIATSVSTPAASSASQASQSPSPSVSTAGSLYQTQFLSVSVPSGWTARQAAGNAAAVNITKGNYILYINANAQQASGVTGGRFAEIAQGAPSADAAVRTWPSDPCNPPVYADLGGSKYFTKRADLYVGPTGLDRSVAPCNSPTNGATAWYLSYFTDQRNGYFNYYVDGQGPAFVATMSYQTDNVNALPKTGSPELSAALDEMTAIATTLVIAGR